MDQQNITIDKLSNQLEFNKKEIENLKLKLLDKNNINSEMNELNTN